MSYFTTIKFSHQLPASMHLIDETNYHPWSKSMLLLLKFFCRDEYINESLMATYLDGIIRNGNDEWNREDNKVMLIIMINISNENQALVCRCENAPEMWMMLEERYGGVWETDGVD